MDRPTCDVAPWPCLRIVGKRERDKLRGVCDGGGPYWEGIRSVRASIVVLPCTSVRGGPVGI